MGSNDKGAEMLTTLDAQGKPSAVFVHPGEEGERIAEIKAMASVPWQCGSDIAPSIARGPMIRTTPRESYITDSGNIARRRSGAYGRDGARVASAFDRMEAAARKAHKGRVDRARQEGREPPDLLLPFTPGQAQMGEYYAALAERVESSGLACSSVEATAGRGSGSGGKEEAVLDDIRRLRVLRRRIGDGIAKSSLRPSKQMGANKRVAIRVRDLVDRVCRYGWTIDQVLDHFGWDKSGKNREPLQKALAAALDRMQGYDLDQPQ